MPNKAEDDMIARLDAKRRAEKQLRGALDRALAVLTPRERVDAERLAERVADSVRRSE